MAETEQRGGPAVSVPARSEPQRTTQAPPVRTEEERPADEPEHWPAKAPARAKWLGPKRLAGLAVVAALVVAAIVYGVHWYVHALHYESTDDAFVEAHVVQVSPRVAGHVSEVLVDDNQQVKAEQVLVRLDPRDFEARQARAQAALAVAKSKEQAAKTQVDLTTLTAEAEKAQAASGVEAAQSAVDRANETVTAARSALQQAEAQAAADKATLERDQGDLDRIKQAAARGAATSQELEHAVATVSVSRAKLEASNKAVATARALIGQAQAAVKEAQGRLAVAKGQLAAANVVSQRIDVAKSQLAQATADVAQASADLRTAELELSYTTVKAAMDGKVTKKNVEPGDYVQVGQPLMALVSPEVWVTANFKENQLRYMKPGDPVDLTVDAYPGHVFHGHVDSIQAGTGARFSLLPPENATGNYIKVVQRVPVKILVDDAEKFGRPLSPGMSVVPDVRVR